MKLKEWINLLIILVLLGVGYLKYRSQTYVANQSRILLDTFIEIVVRSEDKGVDRLVEGAFAVIESYEQKFSAYDEQSILYQINLRHQTPDLSQQTSEQVSLVSNQLDEDFVEIFRLAKDLYYRSGGAYDVSIGRLISLWEGALRNYEAGNRNYEDVVPEQAMIDEALSFCGFDKVVFDDDTLSMPAGFTLNFGSLAKGYIIDKVMEYLIEQNVVEASINAGGDMRLYSRGKRKWKIGVQHPREPHTLIAKLKVPDIAVVTSGDYERYFEIDGVRYHHILNPHTGYPATQVVSVTILSPSAFIADALSTAAFVMSPDEAIELIKSFPDTEGIIYTYDDDEEPVAIKTQGIMNYEVGIKN